MVWVPYTDSDSATGSISFIGLWVHDPLDSEGTIRQYLYGSAQRSSAVSVEHDESYFAGRSYPVFDWGDQMEESFAVRVDVPHGTTWRSDLDALEALAQQQRIVTARDGRGRSVTGAMSGYKENDQKWGTSVSFVVTRAYEETVVG